MERVKRHPVRRYLDRTGETQRALAKRAGVPEGLLSDVLRYRIPATLKMAVKLELATGVPVAQIAKPALSRILKEYVERSKASAGFGKETSNVA